MKQTLKSKLISEALDFYRISSLLDDDDDYDENFEDDEFGEDEEYGEDGEFEEEFHTDDFDEEFDEEFDDEDDDDFNDDPEDDSESAEDEFDEDDFEDTNPNKDGMIRTVKGAYLVYKRATPESNFEELWIYNMGNVKSQTRIRNAILAGTDIDPVSLRSPENDQTGEIWSKGNVQYLHITGLPN